MLYLPRGEEKPRREEKVVEDQFGRQLAEMRRERGLTQAEVAERVGIHPSQLHRYEAGTAQPTLPVLRGLALALQASIDSLVFTDDLDLSVGSRLRTAFESATLLSEHEQAIVVELIEAFVHAHAAKHRPSKAPRSKT
jgi:transcriptional regulator with XRE-family HTH domain